MNSSKAIRISYCFVSESILVSKVADIAMCPSTESETKLISTVTSLFGTINSYTTSLDLSSCSGVTNLPFTRTSTFLVGMISLKESKLAP